MTLAAGIMMLGILIIIHELGHFTVAKLFGVKVLTFSLGFGPRIASWRRGETEYRLSAIPLGGYVQMLGEGAGEEGELDELTPEERGRAFATQPLARRFAIVAAGPLMNLVLPFLVLPLAYMVGVEHPAYLDRPACVGYVSTDSPAALSGFVPGDCILSVNGQTVTSWQQVNESFIIEAGSSLQFTVERGNDQVELQLQAQDAGIDGLLPAGLLPQRPAIIGALASGRPAAEAGLLIGDRILRVGEQPIDSWYQLSGAAAASGGQPVEVEVDRNGSRQVFIVQPALVEETGVYLLGVSPLEETVIKRYGLAGAIVAGSEQAVDLVKLTLVFLQKLFTGSVSTKNIGGPITVFQYAGYAAQTDFSAVLTMLAFLSIQLGILNLLPIPVLDGGHLFFYGIESLRGRPLNRRTREMAQQVGLVLLVLLMVVATYNDLLRLFF